jgi:hypothetical protein
MAAIYSNGGNRWNILGFNFTERDALSSVYKISMVRFSLRTQYSCEKSQSTLCRKSWVFSGRPSFLPPGKGGLG